MDSGQSKNYLWAFIGLLAMVAIVGVVGGLFVLAIRSGSAFGAALIAAAATVGGAVVVRTFERQRVMASIRRDHLGPIYSEMAQVLHGLELPKEKRLELIDEFLRKSLVYGSSATLKAYRTWFTELPDSENWTKQENRENLLRYEAFVKAMRKDLGISNSGLSDGDLARARIHDYDE